MLEKLLTKLGQGFLCSCSNHNVWCLIGVPRHLFIKGDEKISYINLGESFRVCSLRTKTCFARSFWQVHLNLENLGRSISTEPTATLKTFCEPALNSIQKLFSKTSKKQTTLVKDVSGHSWATRNVKLGKYNSAYPFLITGGWFGQ